MSAIIRRLVPLLLAASLFAGTPLADETAGSAAGISREQADAILDELRHIRQLLQRMERLPPPAPPRTDKKPPAPRNLAIGIADRPVLGDPAAPLTLVEFTDFQCPYCRRFFLNTYPKLKADYIDTGKLRLVVKDLPLGFHGQARQAAQAAHCAGDQGAYWKMHDLLQGGSGKLDKPRFLAHAAELGLDTAAFEACIGSPRHLAGIDADAAEAQSIGVTGTPSFILGRSRAERIEGRYIRGALPYPVFQQAIEDLLGAKR